MSGINNISLQNDENKIIKKKINNRANLPKAAVRLWRARDLFVKIKYVNIKSKNRKLFIKSMTQ